MVCVSILVINTLKLSKKMLLHEISLQNTLYWVFKHITVKIVWRIEPSLLVEGRSFRTSPEFLLFVQVVASNRTAEMPCVKVGFTLPIALLNLKLNMKSLSKKKICNNAILNIIIFSFRH